MSCTITQGAPKFRPRVLLGVSDCLASVDFIKLALEIIKFADIAIVLNEKAKDYLNLSNEYDNTSWIEYQRLVTNNQLRLFTDKDTLLL